MKKLDEKKSAVQAEAYKAWTDAGYLGTLAMATGSGKTKIGVDAAVEVKDEILIVTPTTKLRDVRWKDEFDAFGHSDIYKNVERSCYVSINKLKGKHYKLVILDEAHHITPLNYNFFISNKVDRVLALTATPPRDELKQDLLKSIAPIVFRYHLDDAVEEKTVSPYEINVVEFPLDVRRNYEVKTKKHQFKTSESANYAYLSNKIMNLPSEVKFVVGVLPRMRFLYDLPSKLPIAKKILDDHVKDQRCLIYAGSIKRAEELCEHTYHSKGGDKDYWDFVKGKINRLASVQMLNEGEDLPSIDTALITAFNSNPRNLIQQIGRCVRYRPGHKATIWILCSMGTQEEKWLEAATRELDSSNFNFINHKSL